MGSFTAKVLFCILLPFSWVKFLWLTSSMSGAALLQQTFIKLQKQKTAYQKKKQKPSPHILYLQSCICGSEPFSTHQINLRYIITIYKAGMLVHSQNEKKNKQNKQKMKSLTMLKNTTLLCVISTLWCHLPKMKNTIQNVVNFVHKIDYVSKNTHLLFFKMKCCFMFCPWKSSPSVEVIFKSV